MSGPFAIDLGSRVPVTVSPDVWLHHRTQASAYRPSLPTSGDPSPSLNPTYMAPASYSQSSSIQPYSHDADTQAATSSQPQQRKRDRHRARLSRERHLELGFEPMPDFDGEDPHVIAVNHPCTACYEQRTMCVIPPLREGFGERTLWRGSCLPCGRRRGGCAMSSHVGLYEWKPGPGNVLERVLKPAGILKINTAARERAKQARRETVNTESVDDTDTLALSEMGRVPLPNLDGTPDPSVVEAAWEAMASDHQMAPEPSSGRFGRLLWDDGDSVSVPPATQSSLPAPPATQPVHQSHVAQAAPRPAPHLNPAPQNTRLTPQHAAPQPQQAQRAEPQPQQAQQAQRAESQPQQPQRAESQPQQPQRAVPQPQQPQRAAPQPPQPQRATPQPQQAQQAQRAAPQPKQPPPRPQSAAPLPFMPPSAPTVPLMTPDGIPLTAFPPPDPYAHISHENLLLLIHQKDQVIRHLQSLLAKNNVASTSTVAAAAALPIALRPQPQSQPQAAPVQQPAAANKRKRGSAPVAVARCVTPEPIDLPMSEVMIHNPVDHVPIPRKRGRPPSKNKAPKTAPRKSAPARLAPEPAPEPAAPTLQPMQDPERQYEVEIILEMSVISSSGERFFQVRWVGYGDEYNTWEPESEVEHLEAYEEYMEANPDADLRKNVTVKSDSRSPSRRYSPSPAPSSPEDRHSESPPPPARRVTRAASVYTDRPRRNAARNSSVAPGAVPNSPGRVTRSRG